MRPSVLSATVLMMILFALSPAQSRGLLENSQQTFAGACIDAEATPERLVEICESALASAGASSTQLSEIKLELADALYSTDQLDRAQKLIDEILLSDPTNGRAITLAGWLDWDNDAFEQAARHFEESIAVGPTSQNLAGMASSQHRSGQISQDDFLLLMDTALAISPSYTWAMREKAWAQIDFGALQDAEATFRQAYAQDPENTWTLYGLGYVLNKQDQHRSALEYLNRAAQDPEAPTNVYSQRSLARFYIGRYKLALADADRVIEKWPDSAVGYVRRARAMAAMGQRQTAITELRARLERDPDRWTTYWLADLLLDDERYAEGLAALEWTFEHGTPAYHDHELRALFLVMLQRNEDAKVAIENALKLDATASFPHYYHALVLVDEGAFEQADAAMWRALDNGLPEREVKFFLEALAGKGAFVHAIQWRVAWRDRQEAQKP